MKMVESYYNQFGYKAGQYIEIYWEIEPSRLKPNRLKIISILPNDWNWELSSENTGADNSTLDSYSNSLGDHYERFSCGFLTMLS